MFWICWIDKSGISWFQQLFFKNISTGGILSESPPQMQLNRRALIPLSWQISLQASTCCFIPLSWTVLFYCQQNPFLASPSSSETEAMDLSTIIKAPLGISDLAKTPLPLSFDHSTFRDWILFKKYWSRDMSFPSSFDLKILLQSPPAYFSRSLIFSSSSFTFLS